MSEMSRAAKKTSCGHNVNVFTLGAFTSYPIKFVYVGSVIAFLFISSFWTCILGPYCIYSIISHWLIKLFFIILCGL